jgi:hypothetical protein
VIGLLQRTFLDFSLAHDVDAFECWYSKRAREIREREREKYV